MSILSTLVLVALLGWLIWRFNGNHMAVNARRIGLDGKSAQFDEWCRLLEQEGWVKSASDIWTKVYSIKLSEQNREESARLTRVLKMTNNILTSDILGDLTTIGIDGKTTIKKDALRLETRIGGGGSAEHRHYVWYRNMIQAYNSIAPDPNVHVMISYGCRHRKDINSHLLYEHCTICNQIMALTETQYERADLYYMGIEIS